jgi:two-component system, NarL family, nitrate/nitrite response regulator NarL
LARVRNVEMADGGNEASADEEPRGARLNILIVARTRCYREALAQALRGPMSENIACVATAADAIEPVRARPWDAVLLDIPPSEARELIRSVERLQLVTKVIAFSVPETGSDVVEWARAGASACITRDTPLAELPSLIERAARGEPISSPRVAGLLFHRVRLDAYASKDTDRPRLTDRETEVLRLVARGLSNKEVARALSIQLPTVKNHLQRVFRKLGTRRRADAAAWLSADEASRN